MTAGQLTVLILSNHSRRLSEEQVPQRRNLRAHTRRPDLVDSNMHCTRVLDERTPGKLVASSGGERGVEASEEAARLGRDDPSRHS